MSLKNLLAIIQIRKYDKFNDARVGGVPLLVVFILLTINYKQRRLQGVNSD